MQEFFDFSRLMEKLNKMVQKNQPKLLECKSLEDLVYEYFLSHSCQMLRVSAECMACKCVSECVCVIFQSTFELSFSHRHANTIVRILAIAFPLELRKKELFRLLLYSLSSCGVLKSVE